MPKVKITVLESHCRGGHFSAGDTFIVEDLCPPLCHELWNMAYPYVFSLQNGANLDCGDSRTTYFEMQCPDEGRVRIRGEVI